MNKYDWTNVPMSVNWLAKDQSGHVFGFFNKPELVSGVWKGRCVDGVLKLKLKTDANYFFSLEERPNEFRKN